MTTIKHIVLLSFQSTLSKTEIEQVMLSLAELRKVIPQILSFSWGENNSPENLHCGYLHGFVMEFKNAADRDSYLEHPEHRRVANDILLPALKKGKESLIVFDY